MCRLNYYKDQWEDFFANIDFTDEEKQIIELVRRGWCQEDIAAELYLSRRTIARRYNSIFSKITRYENGQKLSIPSHTDVIKQLLKQV